MTDKPLDYTKLSKAKKDIVRKVYQRGYCGTLTYETEKQSLQNNGWLKTGDFSTRLVLTPAGRAAFEAAQPAPAAASEEASDGR